MTPAHTLIRRDWRHGDDSRAARWLRRYHRLRYPPQCLRYFRTNPMAYPVHIRQLFTRAYRRIQLRREKTATTHHAHQ